MMRILILLMTVMMTMMGHGYDEDPYLFHIRFNSPVRVIINDDNGDDEIGCRGCVVIIIIMTVGDAGCTRSHHYHDCW